MNKKYSLITNDVETTSLWNHKLSRKTGEIVLKDGMPLLLEIYECYNVKATFYFNGDIVKLYPEVARMVLPYGHEVACHGLTHEADKAFDILTLEEQINHLATSKKMLEDICGHEVISFRAPALRVNKFTPAALEKTGFKTDSSIAPQRVDMFLSFGSKGKLRWLGAPRTPYFTKPDDLSRRGIGPIFEIPVSSFMLPYAGTVMRISPALLSAVRTMLHFETSLTKRPIVFLIHPNELINEQIDNTPIIRRAKGYISYLLGDKLRYHLKLRNLGEKAIPLLNAQLIYLSKRNYNFITVKEYYNFINNSNETVSKKG